MSNKAAIALAAELLKKVRSNCSIAERLRLFRGNARGIDIARAVAFVGQISLLLQHPEQRADGGITRPVGQFAMDLAGRGAAVAIDDFHDLPLAPAQRRQGRLCHENTSKGVDNRAATAGIVLDAVLVVLKI